MSHDVSLLYFPSTSFLQYSGRGLLGNIHPMRRGGTGKDSRKVDYGFFYDFSIKRLSVGPEYKIN